MDTFESLTRQQHYEAVWSTPMRVLSKRFDLSDVRLAKVCGRHQIPRPGKGYWAKLTSRFPERKTPLPPVNDPGLEVISLVELPPEAEGAGGAGGAGGAEPRFAEDDGVNAPILAEMKRSPVAVAKSLRSPHPLVAAAEADDDIRAAEARAAQGPRGWFGVRSAERESLARADIDLSRALRPRAYRVMDALLKAAQERGCSCQDHYGFLPERNTTLNSISSETRRVDVSLPALSQKVITEHRARPLRLGHEPVEGYSARQKHSRTP